MTTRPYALYPSLKDKTVFISGGGSGIGAAFVRAFAAQGARVAFVDVAREPSEALAAELGGSVSFHHCDVTDIAAYERVIAAAAAALGPIGVLVNNAAHDQRHTTDDVTPDYFDARLAINLKHQFFAARTVRPMMKALGGGSIVNMGSIAWRVGSGYPVYAMAKAAIEAMTRALAVEFGPDNIRVNTLAPGWTITERQRELWLTPEADAQLMKDQALKRHILPDEIARVGLFLASDEASACTKQTYIVDGGWA
jgi:NAD(P)-dependent dehydrogenase (short-subunit alcohol dehydrogenase family)